MNLMTGTIIFYEDAVDILSTVWSPLPAIMIYTESVHWMSSLAYMDSDLSRDKF